MQIAAQVLAAVVPAWVAGGGSIEEVVGEVVSVASGIPSHRRLAVFSALVGALPKVSTSLGWLNQHSLALNATRSLA